MIHGIYVPGLGDDRSRGQDNAIRGWVKFGVSLEYHPVSWAIAEPLDDKLECLQQKIDQLHSRHGAIALIGSSAGASAVLNAYVRNTNKVRRVVSICGKIQNPDSLKTDDFIKNPAFEESLGRLPRTLEQFSQTQLDAVLSVRPLYDGRVPIADTHIPGAHEMIIPTFGHAISIAYAITLGKKRIAQFITT